MTITIEPDAGDGTTGGRSVSITQIAGNPSAVVAMVMCVDALFAFGFSLSELGDAAGQVADKLSAGREVPKSGPGGIVNN